MGDVPRIFVVGSLNADHRVRVGKIPLAGETVLGSPVAVAAGGKGANQAVAASRAGAVVTMIGALGDDHDGELVRDALVASDLDMHHVRVLPGKQTGRALITVDHRGENTIVVSPGANAALDEDDISAGLRSLGPGDLLLLQLETPPRLVTHAARTASDAGGLVVLNAAPVPDSLDGVLDHVDLLIVNEHELSGAAQLLGAQSKVRPTSRADDMALLASASDVRVVCTAGADGAFVTHRHRIEHIGAPVVDSVDTTAAGDTFIGYLAAQLTRDPDDVIAAVETAVRAAALAITRNGAIDSIPSGHEVGGSRQPTTKGLS